MLAGGGRGFKTHALDCCFSLPTGLKATLHPAVSPHILALLIPPASATFLKDLITLRRDVCVRVYLTYNHITGA